jgi:rRNA maturation RNase YbeY
LSTPLLLSYQITNPKAWEILKIDLIWLTNLTNIVRKELELCEVPLEISVLFTDEDTLRGYNRTYRGKDHATNVLAFPSYRREEVVPLLKKGSLEPLILGDIAIAFETLEREALSFQIPFEHHLIHLFFHGVLHLLGYDHEIEKEAEEMEKLEIRLLSQKSIPNPYKTWQNSLLFFE